MSPSSTAMPSRSNSTICGVFTGIIPTLPPTGSGCPDSGAQCVRLLALSVSTTLINTPIHGGPCLEFTLQRVRCVEPLRDLEPFLRVSRVHSLLITPRNVRFRRISPLQPALIQGATQKLRCARHSLGTMFALTRHPH